MKTILLKILHYLWVRRENIYSAYLRVKSNPKINIDWKLNFNEFMEYSKIFEESWVTKESFDLDDKILTWDIVNWKVSWNNSKRLTFNQQVGPVCVPTSLIRMINYNVSINITEKLRLEYIEDMYRLKIMTSKWSSVQKVADYLKKKIAQDFWRDLTYFKETIWSNKYKELMTKEYAHSLWGGITSEYIVDFREDWKIDIENYSFKEEIDYYHLFMNLPEDEAKQRGWNIVENYNKRFWVRNVYKNDHIADFGKKGVFFNYGYFFIESHNIDKEKLEEEKEKLNKNRFYKHLVPHLANWYESAFSDHEDPTPITAWECKTMFDLGYIRKSK